MQSSVRSETPRQAPPNSFFNGAVQIMEGVTVTSTSRAETPTGTRRAMYSTMPPIPNSHKRSKTAGSDASRLIRIGSKASDKSSAYHARSSMQRQHISDDLLDSNRDSMKALAEFLMNSEPPSSNWVSAYSSEDDRSITTLKRSALKIFGKEKKKKPKAPRFLQLPDSVVAAKTRSGARHIAISIPLKHDPVQEKEDLPTLPPSRQSSRFSELHQKPRPNRELAQRVERDRAQIHPFTVLKPVREVRESVSSYLSISPESKDELRKFLDHNQDQADSGVPETRTTPAAEVIEVDTARTLEKYYKHINDNPRPRSKGAAEIASTSKLDPSRSQRSYIVVSPADMDRQDSQQSDPRHSGGTQYDTASMLITQQGHSRDPSKVSTVPRATVISSLKLDLPPKNSSIPKTQPSEKEREKDPAMAPSVSGQNAKRHTRNLSAVSDVSGIESLTSVGTSPSPPTVFGLAEARNYSSARQGPQLVRSTTTRHSTTGSVGAGPSRSSLQANGNISRPRTAPLTNSELGIATNMEGLQTTRPIALHRTREEAVISPQPRSSRRERVKARKQRDIQALRFKSLPRPSSSQSPISSEDHLPQRFNHQQPGPISPLIALAPAKSLKRNRGLQELALRRNANTFSPVMLLASIPPYSNAGTQTSPGLQAIRMTLTKGKTRDESRETHTPPMSRRTSTSHSEAGSDGAHSPETIRRTIRHSTQSLRSTMLETRRQERRAKRNMSLREKELDARLNKIEYDNVILLHTLSGIAKSFGDLNRMQRDYPAKRRIGVADRHGRQVFYSSGDEDEEVGSVNVNVNVRRQGGVWGRDRDVMGEAERRLSELGDMEGFMQELAGAAPRVSAESVSTRQPVFGDEFDDDDEDEGKGG